MNRIRILCPGRLKFRELAPLEARYLERISRFADIELHEMKSPPAQNDRDLSSREASLFHRHLSREDWVMACDEKGRKMNSAAFSRFLCHKLETLGSRQMVILIGGPAGLDPVLHSRLDACVSFSPMTFAHDIFRTILLEQIYRAFAIHHRLPYHR